MKIQLCQSLYERYSTLGLSFEADRPIAIRGLEKRLIRTFQTVGGYGVFDCYLHRGLLWHRSSEYFKRIETFHGNIIPSWSWMAYVGGIKYLEVPLGGVLWSKEIYSPWSETGRDGDTDMKWPQMVGMNSVKALAWEFERLTEYKKLIMDDIDCTFKRPLRVVIVGTDKQEVIETTRKHYVLIVANIHGEMDNLYERVGVGIVEEALIIRYKPAIGIYLI
jgi:hypothetical protein